jgi:hypothetical protein
VGSGGFGVSAGGNAVRSSDARREPAERAPNRREAARLGAFFDAGASRLVREDEVE